MTDNSWLILDALLTFVVGIVVGLVYKQWADSNLRHKHWKEMENLREEHRKEAEAMRGKGEAERRYQLLPSPYTSTFPPHPYEYGILTGTVRGIDVRLDKLTKRIKQLEDERQAGAA
jgi:hypothetical protein